MYNTKSKFHKGSSVLVSTLITAAASAMIGYGITKMIATGIDSINNQQIKMQAQQYAASRINVLRSVRYDNLAGMTKRQIGTTDYYEEVTKTGDSDGSTGDAYQVAIYKGADSNNPVTTMNFYRSNPGILLDNQVESGSGNADSSALIQSALKDYTNSQFGENSESESSSKAMGIKSFTSYVDGLLSKYRINAVAAWNIDSSDTFNQNGSDRRPIYIDKGSRYNYAAQGSVTYSMSGNSEGYLATVTPAGNGLYYVDYIEKDTTEESKPEEKPSVKPPASSSESIAVNISGWEEIDPQHDDVGQVGSAWINSYVGFTKQNYKLSFGTLKEMRVLTDITVWDHNDNPEVHPNLGIEGTTTAEWKKKIDGKEYSLWFDGCSVILKGKIGFYQYYPDNFYFYCTSSSKDLDIVDKFIVARSSVVMHIKIEI